MKNLKNILGTCVILLLLAVSCKNNEGQIPIAERWECGVSNLKDTFDIQSLFADRYILGLEETEKSRVGAIAKVMIEDSLLFVLDNRLAMRLFVFNVNTGKFINSIGRTGNGAGEYVDVNDCSVNPTDSTVSMLCGRNKVNVYDYSGNYKCQKELSFFADKMECKGEKYYFSCYDYGRGNLIVTDSDMHELASYFVLKPEVPVLIQNHPLQRLSDGTIVFFRYLDDNIYSVDDNDGLVVHCQIDFGKDKLDYSKVTKLGEFEENHRCHLQYYTENDKYAWILFYDHDNPHESILDKSTGKMLAFPADHMIDSALGNYDNPIEFGIQDRMAILLSSESVKDDLVRNKDCNRGSNPAIYFLVNK